MGQADQYEDRRRRYNRGLVAVVNRKLLCDIATVTPRARAQLIIQVQLKISSSQISRSGGRVRGCSQAS